MTSNSKGFILMIVVVVCLGVAILLMDIERMVLMHGHLVTELTQ